jgi:hypothetical protein
LCSCWDILVNDDKWTRGWQTFKKKDPNKLEEGYIEAWDIVILKNISVTGPFILMNTYHRLNNTQPLPEILSFGLYLSYMIKQ